MNQKISYYPDHIILEIFKRFAKNNPNPQGELYYKDAFTLLIAVLLSAQATDVSVNKVTKNLFAKAPDVQSMAKLSEEELSKLIQSIGLWRNKAKNIKALCKILLEEYHGKVPNNRNDLMKLPGVGRKTASVVLNVAFHAPTLAVDTHIFRIANRIKLAPAPTPLEVEEKLIKIIPKDYLQNAHIWLILHGRYICKARKPDCPQCILKDLCLAPIKKELYPQLDTRKI